MVIHGILLDNVKGKCVVKDVEDGEWRERLTEAIGADCLTNVRRSIADIDVSVTVDDAGLLKKLPPSLFGTGCQSLAGPAFICGVGRDREDRSLTDDEVRRIMERVKRDHTITGVRPCSFDRSGFGPWVPVAVYSTQCLERMVVSTPEAVRLKGPNGSTVKFERDGERVRAESKVGKFTFSWTFDEASASGGELNLFNAGMSVGSVSYTDMSILATTSETMCIGRL